MHIAFRASRFERGQREEGRSISIARWRWTSIPASSASYARPNALNYASSSRTCSMGSPEEPVNISKAACRLRFWPGAVPKRWLSGHYDPSVLSNPHTGKFAFAVLQLRQDNLADTLYNMVGFQTNLTFPEQKTRLPHDPGPGNAEFVRYGQMHRIPSSPHHYCSGQPCSSPNGKTCFLPGKSPEWKGIMGNIATGLFSRSQCRPVDQKA